MSNAEQATQYIMITKFLLPRAEIIRFTMFRFFASDVTSRKATKSCNDAVIIIVV